MCSPRNFLNINTSAGNCSISNRETYTKACRIFCHWWKYRRTRFSPGFLLINWAILFFLINKLRQIFCLRFKKKKVPENRHRMKRAGIAATLALAQQNRHMQSLAWTWYAVHCSGTDAILQLNNTQYLVMGKQASSGRTDGSMADRCEKLSCNSMHLYQREGARVELLLMGYKIITGLVTFTTLLASMK
jgi:hypothetical protein